MADQPTHGRYHNYSNRVCRCTVCRAAWTAYCLRLRKARILRGVCIECKEKALRSVRCEKHRLAHNASAAVMYAKRKATHAAS